MNTSPKVLALLLATTAFAAPYAQAYQRNKTYHYTIVHTNDTHGRFWQNNRGEYGMSAHKTLIDQIRADVEKEGGSVIVLHAGDINTGVPESDIQNAHPDIEAMNAIQFDAMTLGNHEFDNPLQVLDMQEKWAKFPFLSANIYYKDTQKRVVKPYEIVQRGGLKFAIVGLTTEDTAFLSNPEYTKKLDFRNAQTTASEVLAKINRDENPDVRIALTHMGYYHDGKHGHSAPGDVSLARALPKSAFDAIVGGHSHTEVCLDEQGNLDTQRKPSDTCKPDFQNGSWIMQAGYWGKYIGRADFEFRNGQSRLVRYQLIPVNLKNKDNILFGKEISEDQALHAKLKTYQDKGDSILAEKIGESDDVFMGERNIARLQQTHLGQLVARAQMERTQADVAVINSGGIRDSLPKGDISYRDVLKVQPFGNILSKVTLTGQELQDYLAVVVKKDAGSGGYPQLAGVTMTIDPKNCQSPISNIRVGGKPLDLKKNYSLSLPDYVAGGGDAYPIMKTKASFVNTNVVDAVALKEYIHKHSPLKVSDYAPLQAITPVQCTK